MSNAPKTDLHRFLKTLPPEMRKKAQADLAAGTADAAMVNNESKQLFDAALDCVLNIAAIAVAMSTDEKEQQFVHRAATLSITTLVVVRTVLDKMVPDKPRAQMLQALLNGVAVEQPRFEASLAELIPKGVEKRRAVRERADEAKQADEMVQPAAVGVDLGFDPPAVVVTDEVPNG